MRYIVKIKCRGEWRSKSYRFESEGIARWFFNSHSVSPDVKSIVLLDDKEGAYAPVAICRATN